MGIESMAPLGERGELCSPAWIMSAADFCATEQAGGLEYRLAAQFMNPPPHLAPDGKPLGITIEFSAAGVTARSGADADADWLQTADYNRAIPFQSIVYADNPRGERLRDEYEAAFGSPFDVTEKKPVPEPIQQAMGRLHDHLARRTLSNPDLEHRAKHLGLESNLRDLDTKGYTVMPGAFSASYADELREETHKNHAGRDDGASFRATMLLQRGRIWEEAAVHPWVLTVVEYLVGRGALLYQSDTIVKSPGQETHPGLHSDYAASRITEPFPDYCVEGTALWAIDDFHAEHGPTCILPGSVEKRSQVPPGTTQEGTKLLELDQGSIAFWHGGLWHGSTPRTAPGKRTSLHNAYCRNFIRPLESYLDIEPAIVARNPPSFSTICGLDDAFGKSGMDGADFERLGYAGQLGFGSSAAPSI